MTSFNLPGRDRNRVHSYAFVPDPIRLGLDLLQSVPDVKTFDKGKAGFHEFESERGHDQAFDPTVISLAHSVQEIDLPTI